MESVSHFPVRQQEQVPVVDELQAAVRNEPMHELRIGHVDQRIARARENERRLPEAPKPGHARPSRERELLQEIPAPVRRLHVPARTAS